MTCLECKNLNLQSSAAHARVGMGRCSQRTNSGVFVSFRFKRECSKFSRVDGDILMKRLAWSEKK